MSAPQLGVERGPVGLVALEDRWRGPTTAAAPTARTAAAASSASRTRASPGRRACRRRPGWSGRAGAPCAHAGTLLTVRQYFSSAPNSPVSSSRSTRSVDLVLGRVRVGAAQLPRAQPAQLEDLEHVDEVDAGREREQRSSAAIDHRPAGVEIAVVVASTGRSAARPRAPAIVQRPRVQVEHGPALREADPVEAVVEVVGVAAVDRAPVLDPLGHHEARVEERHGEHDQRARRARSGRWS